MRLLNTKTLTLKSFIQDVPPYVILSHTWGDGEITFDDIDKAHAKDMAGYKKIASCCQQAVLDGFDWIWIDTCCIDKRSSSELSEAINSMYNWYWHAEICYAYLADVSGGEAGDELSMSRWFTRGWTLQELLAPDVVEFYNDNWRLLGTKASLLEAIKSATNIGEPYLMDRENIRRAGIATKFSWASERKTTRSEDMTYCLLGLMDITMPMLYGEGGKAFYRLQLEILKKTNEHSIFAWETHAKSGVKATGMLSPSPKFFAKSGQFSDGPTSRSSTHEITNKGLKIVLPVQISKHGHKHGPALILAVLNCYNEQNQQVGIWLAAIGTSNEQYRKIAGAHLKLLGENERVVGPSKKMYIIVEDHNEEYASNETYSIRVTNPNTELSPYKLQELVTGSRGDLGLSVPRLQERPSALEQIQHEPLTLHNDEFGGLFFASEFKSSLLIFGQHHGRIWFRLIRGVSLNRSAEEFWDLVRETERVGFRWQILGDYLQKRLEDDVWLTVEAKRKRIGSSLLWHLTITVDRDLRQISQEATGSPATSGGEKTRTVPDIALQQFNFDLAKIE